MYVLNSKEAMNELLDRRSGVYSSKPGLTMIHEYTPALFYHIPQVDLGRAQGGLHKRDPTPPVRAAAEDVQTPPAERPRARCGEELCSVSKPGVCVLLGPDAGRPGAVCEAFYSVCISFPRLLI